MSKTEENLCSICATHLCCFCQYKENRYDTRGDDIPETSGIDMQRAMDFIEGYHQAEKDNELTWKDIEKVCLIAREVHQFRGFWSESVYQEVLKRFKDLKK